MLTMKRVRIYRVLSLCCAVLQVVPWIIGAIVGPGRFTEMFACGLAVLSTGFFILLGLLSDLLRRCAADLRERGNQKPGRPETATNGT